MGQISWVLLGKIYCVLRMNMGMYMPKNHELFLPGMLSADKSIVDTQQNYSCSH